VLTFLQSGVDKLLAWLGIELTTLDLSSQSVASGLSATVTPSDHPFQSRKYIDIARVFLNKMKNQEWECSFVWGGTHWEH